MEYLRDVYISQCNVLLVNLGQILRALGTYEMSCVSLPDCTLDSFYSFRNRMREKRSDMYSEWRSENFCLERNVSLVCLYTCQ